jgi:glyoxylase-like metal-dependent hydrolase (beta-lactamase superfamily II)
MEINKIVSGVLHNNTYVITSGDEAIIIDANASVDMLKPYLDGKKVKGIFITHGHFDHIFSLESLLKEFDCKCFIHKNGVEKFENVDLNCSYFFVKQTFDIPQEKIEVVKEDDVIEFDNIKVKVIELPGHTNCGLGFVIEKDIFCGDTIFSSGYGRTDLATSSDKDLMASINKINNNYINYTLYSGHGSESIVGHI